MAARVRCRISEAKKYWNTDNHVHLDTLVRPYGAACMRKLDRIIGDPPIDHVRETRNDRHALRTEREEEKEKRKGRKKEISRGDQEDLSPHRKVWIDS